MSKNLPATKPKANKQSTCNSEQDLGDYLKSVDDDVLMFAVRSKLLEQPFSDTTNDSIEVLFENKERFYRN